MYVHVHVRVCMGCICRYYAVEFSVEQHAVSIRQRQKLSRQTRNWGESRLAVEGQSPGRTPEHVLYTVCMYMYNTAEQPWWPK